MHDRTLIDSNDDRLTNTSLYRITRRKLALLMAK